MVFLLRCKFSGNIALCLLINQLLILSTSTQQGLCLSRLCSSGGGWWMNEGHRDAVGSLCWCKGLDLRKNNDWWIGSGNFLLNKEQSGQNGTTALFLLISMETLLPDSNHIGKLKMGTMHQRMQIKPSFVHNAKNNSLCGERAGAVSQWILISTSYTDL